MATYLLESLRRLAEPEYSRLPTADGEHEPKSLAPSGGVVSNILALPALFARCVFLCWLLVTKPFRRGGGGGSTAWPALFAQLGVFQVLVPSFLHPVEPGQAPRRLHPTSWLDGMRGVAALLVVAHHSCMLGFGDHIRRGYGSGPDEVWVMQLPILRLLYAGPPQVTLFYVISGYALSYKPLKLARSRRFTDAYAAISSSAFRRWPRLFLMPIVVTFVSAVMAYFHVFGTHGWSYGLHGRSPPIKESFAAQMAHWLPSVMHLTDPFSQNLRRGQGYVYDHFLWTLPIEFDCSLMLFLCQAAFTRLRPTARLAIMFCNAVFTMKYGHWQVFLFIVGMIICELQFMFDSMRAAAAELPEIPTITATMADDFPAAEYQVLVSPVTRGRSILARFHTHIGIVVFVLSLYILSFPDASYGAAITPGFRTMYKWIPALHIANKLDDFFWVPLGAALCVFVVDRTPPLQILFSNRLSQYLGRISYSMYVVHGPILFTAGQRYIRLTTALTGVDTTLHYGCGVALAFALYLPTLIFVADFVSRTLDQWSLNVGRRAYEALSFSEDEAETRTATP